MTGPIGEYAHRVVDAFRLEGHSEELVAAFGRDIRRVEVEARAEVVRADSHEKDLIFEDLSAILRALGLGDHARPISAHDVVQREILPAIQGLRKIVERAAHMGFCSQTHHEHLWREARAALQGREEP